MAADGSVPLRRFVWYWPKEGEPVRTLSIRLPESVELALLRLYPDSRTVNSYIAGYALPKFVRTEEIEQRGVLSRPEVTAMAAWLDAQEVEGLKAMATFAKVRAGETVTEDERRQAERVFGMALGKRKAESG